MSRTPVQKAESDGPRIIRLIPSARQANAFLFPGFRQSFIQTEGVEVAGERRRP